MHDHVAIAEERKWIAELHDKLHSMCQPMTALQCRLELGRDADNVSALQTTIDEAMVECDRLSAGVHALQKVMRRVMRDMDGKEGNQ